MTTISSAKAYKQYLMYKRYIFLASLPDDSDALSPEDIDNFLSEMLDDEERQMYEEYVREKYLVD